MKPFFLTTDLDRHRFSKGFFNMWFQFLLVLPCPVYPLQTSKKGTYLQCMLQRKGNQCFIFDAWTSRVLYPQKTTENILDRIASWSERASTWQNYLLELSLKIHCCCQLHWHFVIYAFHSWPHLFLGANCECLVVGYWNSKQISCTMENDSIVCISTILN